MQEKYTYKSHGCVMGMVSLRSFLFLVLMVWVDIKYNDPRHTGKFI